MVDATLDRSRSRRRRGPLAIGVLLVTGLLAAVLAGDRWSEPVLSLVHGDPGESGLAEWPGGLAGRATDGQRRGGRWITDPATGRRYLVDGPNVSLSGSGTNRSREPSVELVPGAEGAYIVDEAAGTLVRVNPSTLEPVAEPVALGGPVVAVSAHDSGQLWLFKEATGELIAIEEGEVAGRRMVAEPGRPVQLSVSGGQPVILDEQSRTLTVGEDQVQLRGVADGPLLLQAPGEGSTASVWLLETARARLVAIDGTGEVVREAKLVPGHDLGDPVANAGLVFLADFSTGEVVIVDASSGSVFPPVKVPATWNRFTLGVRGGTVVASDPAAPAAIAFDAQGKPQLITK